jgi:hypothetical protein
LQLGLKQPLVMLLPEVGLQYVNQLPCLELPHLLSLLLQ